MQAAGMKPRHKRRWDGIAQWVVVLDTGRFGDWVVLETDDRADADDVRKLLTRTQKRKASLIRKVVR